ncbi:MAG TPA: hypothetical protein VG101_08955 [Puia sp.]|jgi:hypothetical protein|nr:hypothetical protein [Puia sp.]
MLLYLTNLNGAQRQPLKPAPEGQPMPSFNLLMTDGVTRISTGAIPPGRPVVLVLFSPECLYCRTEIDSIIGQMLTLADIRFFFVTPCPIADVREFSLEYRLDKYPNVVVGMDYDNFLLRFSGTKIIPYTAIYDEDLRLREAMFGRATDRKIKEVLFR